VVAAHGQTKTVHYEVGPDDSVRALAHRGPEFRRKPDVMASARLLELAELPCMDVLREHIAPHQCTLGTRQHVEHRGAVAIGARLTITARCAVAEGAYSEWRVTVHDGHEDVWRGTLGFVVVDLADFERRHLGPKQRARLPADGSPTAPARARRLRQTG
jgi:predicted thioesterase